eukprot:scaffold4182_cov384-Prasinococcus_capsulatus_cf.AAC.3
MSTVITHLSSICQLVRSKQQYVTVSRGGSSGQEGRIALALDHVGVAPVDLHGHYFAAVLRKCAHCPLKSLGHNCRSPKGGTPSTQTRRCPCRLQLAGSHRDWRACTCLQSTESFLRSSRNGIYEPLCGCQR